MNETKPTKVYGIEILVVDHEDIGFEEIKDALENANYPNDCINPRVMGYMEEMVNWNDEHPLNKTDIFKDAFYELFVGETKD